MSFLPEVYESMLKSIFGLFMTRMVAKLSPNRGWAHGPHPAGILADHLKTMVDENAFDSIMPRHDGSFLFLVHNAFEDEVLSHSGQNGIFFNRHVCLRTRFSS